MGLFGGKKKQQPAAMAPVPTGPLPPRQMPWDAGKFKIQLRMGRTRIEVQRTKKDNNIINNRRTASEHLTSGKDELARIFAEKVLRERSQIEAFDVAMTYVELLIESSQMFEHVRDFNQAAQDIQESVASIVYSAQRMSIHELYVAASMLREHFGPSVIDPIARGDEGPYLRCVNSILSVKLDTTAPDPALVREELIQIANEFEVDWTAPYDTYSGGMAQPAYNPHHFQPPPNFGGQPPSAPPPPSNDFYGGGGGGSGVMADSIPGLYPAPQGPMVPNMPSYAPTALSMVQPMAPTAPTAPPDPVEPTAPIAPPPRGNVDPSLPPPPPGPSLDDDDLTARLNRLQGGGS